MAVDQRVQDAIVAAAREIGQPDGLASRLIAWFGALSEGTATFEQSDDVQRWLELLFDEIPDPTLAEEMS